MAIFVAGLGVGIIIMGYLSMRASKTFLEVFRSNYYAEQNDLAAEAHREGNKYNEFLYRKNVVDTTLFGKLSVFNTTKSTWTFGFPFAAPILDRIIATPGIDKGRQRVYGIDVGRLAEATENIGLKEEAANLWEESAKLTEINDINRLRSLISDLHNIDDKYKTTKPNK